MKMFSLLRNAVCGVRRVASATYRGFYIYPYQGLWEYAETEYRFMSTVWGSCATKEDCKMEIDKYLLGETGN